MRNIITLFVLMGLSDLWAQDDELDLDALWDNTVWTEIEEINTIEGEVEQVITVAGVRGAEAEDENFPKGEFVYAGKTVLFSPQALSRKNVDE